MSSIKTKFVSTLFTFFIALASALAVSYTVGLLDTSCLAASSTAESPFLSVEDKPAGSTSTPLRQAVINLMNWLLGFLGLIAVAFIVYAGVKMVISQGDEEALTSAKNTIIYAGIGFIIIMLSWTIVYWIGSASNQI